MALRNKERTDAVEQERVERERMLEEIERERVTALKSIEKEKTVVVEQEKIKDAEAFAGAERDKQVKVVTAEADAKEILIKEVQEAEARKKAAELKADESAYEVQKAAEASKKASEMRAEERVISAEAELTASQKEADAKKMIADAVVKETSAEGLGKVEVKLADASALKEQGAAQAEVDALKFEAEAKGIEQKAAAMKLFEEAGQEHEEFKLELDKEKAVELAQIDVQRQIAEQQAVVIGEALKQAKIDIVGGESQFFDQITSAVTKGKMADRIVDNSKVLTDVKETFFNGDPDYFKAKIREWSSQFGISSENLKNLTVSTLLGRMIPMAEGETRNQLVSLLGSAERYGLQDKKAGELL